MYFLKQGTCDYVLPKYSNAAYVRIEQHSYFGVVDIIAAALDENCDDAQHLECGSAEDLHSALSADSGDEEFLKNLIEKPMKR